MNPFVIAFRRIIYSIPLKRLLVGLAVFSVLLSSFSSALNVEGRLVYSVSSDGNGIFTVDPSGNFNFNCFRSSSDCGTITLTELGNSSNYTSGNPYNNLVCLLSTNKSNQIRATTNNSRACTYNIVRMNLDTITDEYCSVMSSLECQTEYNLIPIESVDQNYCTTNNLCPTYDCPTNPIGTGSLSNLYINNILHIGAPNIIMNIPEEIDWDYAYTMGGDTMNIDIFGYNQDYEKIEDWIYTNNYKPSSDDFTNIFTNFSNFGGLLIATLFVILVFYFVKKMFK